MDDLRFAEYEVAGDGWLVSTARWRLDVDTIQDLLAGTYWAAGTTRDEVERLLEHCLPFGLYVADMSAPDGWLQAGIARVITDYASFAYLSDVVIEPDQRGRGLGKAFMAALLAHPGLQGLRRFSLLTGDAQGLYAQFGFKPLAAPLEYMELAAPKLDSAP